MTNTTDHSLEYIRQYYQLPAYVGQRVCYRSKFTGTITGGSGSYIKITFDGAEHEDVGRFHPDWEMAYLEAEAGK